MTDRSPDPGQGGDVQRLVAQALGNPGERRFRLVAVVHDETVIIWMEKQQMQALGMAIDQILRQVPEMGPEVDGGNAPYPIDEETEYQFRLGRVELGFDLGADRILINAYDVQDDSGSAGLSMRLSRGQAQEFIRDAGALAAAGRPICPMCGSPIDPGGHICPEQNGHLPLEFESDDLLRDE